MKKEKAMVVFAGRNIRRIWHNDEWFYSVVDVVRVLTQSSIPKRYWSDLKIKLKEEEDFKVYDKIVRLKLESLDGKLRETDCASVETLFRTIQSIPSPNANKFKLWLARVGYERIKEIENPELAQDRVKEYYKLKGYPKDWIDKRLRGIAIRQDLTDEWKQRGVEENKEFAILTNEISKATFGKTVGEYKEFKGLKRLNQNLRDHMTDWELILNMVGEKATTDITISKDDQGFQKCKTSAEEGGTIAKHTRKELEQKIGKSLISEENHLHLAKKKKKELK